MTVLKIISTKTIEIELKHPGTGEVLLDSKGKKMTVTAYGGHTPEFKNSALNAQRKKADDKEGEENASSNNIYAVSILAPVIKSFNNLELETENGLVDPKDIEGTLTSVDWIFEQVQKAVLNRGLFIA